jgi:hypothetical protein
MMFKPWRAIIRVDGGARPNGNHLSAPLNIDANVTWIGYANAAIRDTIQPLLRHALQQRHLIEAQ